MRAKGVIWLAALVMMTAGATATEPADAWKGKSRDDVVALLGAPPKVKRDRERRPVLTYKLLLLEDDFESVPGLVVVHCPGVGLVGRLTGGIDPFAGHSLDIQPTGVDEEGHLVGGGLRPGTTQTIDWSSEDGATVKPERLDEHGVRGKIKLTFKLDSEGRVVDWSVSPKKLLKR